MRRRAGHDRHRRRLLRAVFEEGRRPGRPERVGARPEGARAEWFADQGLAEIAATSPHSVTVPGAVDAWCTLNAEHGTKSLDELFAPAIRFAEEGYRVAPKVAFDWGRNVEKLSHDPDAKAAFLPGGKAPRVGDAMRLPALAKTLRRIASEGRSAFYEGEVAAEIVAKLRHLGGHHSEADFARQRSEAVEPIRTRFRDMEVYECPPNGQGLIALMMLNLAEHVDLGGERPTAPTSWPRSRRPPTTPATRTSAIRPTATCPSSISCPRIGSGACCRISMRAGPRRCRPGTRSRTRTPCT
jgi:gamma-glutamyltranspeptidase